MTRIEESNGQKKKMKVYLDDYFLTGPQSGKLTGHYKNVNDFYLALNDLGFLKVCDNLWTKKEDVTFFIVDTEKLKQYEEILKNTLDEEVYKVYDFLIYGKYTVCYYCHSVSLTNMLTYRDNCGCVSREINCNTCIALDNDAVNNIGEKCRAYGEDAALEEKLKYVALDDNKDSIAS